MFKQMLYAVGLAAMATPAFGAMEWMTDLDAALERAAREDKAVLIDFTGSDWCTWCIRLRKEVLDSPAFEQHIAGKLVPVEIDVPNDPARVGGEASLQKNQQLCLRYGVEAFPTIMVLSSQGQLVGGFVGGVDVAAACKAVDTALENMSTLQQAATLQGKEKLAALKRVYDSLPEDFAYAAKGLQRHMVEADTDDSLGLREEMQIQDERQAIEKRLQSVHPDDYAARLAIIAEEMPQAMPANAELLARMKIYIIQEQIREDFTKAETVEDVLHIKQRILHELVPAIPEKDRAVRTEQIEKQFANPQKLLEKMQRR